jgi:prepilin-type N-terminal cleavage/methylation domain-containing protein
MSTCAQQAGNYPQGNRSIPAQQPSFASKKTLRRADGYPNFNRTACRGFSLLELLVSVLILSVIMGGVISALSNSQQTFARTELGSDMYENVRSVAELMAQEIGQAGLLSLPTTTLSSAVTGSATAQAASVSQTASIYVGEQLLIDAGTTNEELVAITAIGSGTVTGIFTKSHASGAPVTVLGAMPSGIVPPGATDGSTSNTEPGVSVLNLVGDINGDGTLVYVRYTCNTSVTPGTLSRSVTTITPGNNTISSAQTLLSTLIPNPGSPGTPCFQYTPYSVGTPANTYVTNVGLTISVQSLSPDPQTHTYLTMTKSFLDLSPRNVLSAFELGNAGLTQRLQVAPPNVSLY